MRRLRGIATARLRPASDESERGEPEGGEWAEELPRTPDARGAFAPEPPPVPRPALAPRVPPARPAPAVSDAAAAGAGLSSLGRAGFALRRLPPLGASPPKIGRS